MYIDKSRFQKSQNSAEKILGKKLPSSSEAEKAVLGALLLNDEGLSQITEILEAKDFYLPAHTLIYDAIVTIANRMERLDVVTLQNELEKKEFWSKLAASCICFLYKKIYLL
ncbi:MAG: hypothetical protein LVQ75_05235 [Candidatus Babeliales bacterium]|jgi:replicative DNA helicase